MWRRAVRVGLHRVYVGTATGSYDIVADVGPVLTYSLPSAQPNATYYVVVRAYDEGGGLSDATPELSVAIPSRTASELILSAQAGTVLATVLDPSGKPLGGAVVAFSGPAGVVLEPASGVTNAQGTGA